jgi:hypothetical protein
MNKTVAVYYAGIPAKNTNPEKPMVLSKFAAGVRTSTDPVSEIKTPTYTPTDLAVIQGWVHEQSQTTPHLAFRKQVIDGQRANGKHTLAIDSNLFLYRDPGNTKTYLRYSLDDIFPINGCYFNNTVNDVQWNKIKKDLNIDLQPWRTTGEHILICLQRNGGWSMKGTDVMTWCHHVISEIRKYSNRPIVVRGHPGDRRVKDYLRLKIKNVRISTQANILDDFKNAWATITFNSSPGVASAIEGVPVFVMDPIPMHSQAFPIANTNLAAIENPNMPDRQHWINSISMSHFSFNDLESGEAWKVIREYL